MNQLNTTLSEMLTMISEVPDTKSILIRIGFSLILSAVIFTTYRISNTDDDYQPYFAATLVSLAVLSTVLMCLIQSNLALSLGMLGSLSIVRFRTLINDPRDIGFIFWSMAAGLSGATESFLIGLIGSAVMSLVFICTKNRERDMGDMMLVVRGSTSDTKKIQSIINASCARNIIKAKNILKDSFELVYEVHMQMGGSDRMIECIMDLNGVDSVNLLSKTEKMA